MKKQEAKREEREKAEERERREKLAAELEAQVKAEKEEEALYDQEQLGREEEMQSPFAERDSGLMGYVRELMFAYLIGGGTKSYCNACTERSTDLPLLEPC